MRRDGSFSVRNDLSLKKLHMPWGGILSLLLRFLLLLTAAASLLLCLIALYALTLPTASLLKLLTTMCAVVFLAVLPRRRGLVFLLLAGLLGFFVRQHAADFGQGFLLLLEQGLASMDLVQTELLQTFLETADPALEQQRLLYAVGLLFALLLPLLACCTVTGTSAVGLLLCTVPLLLPGLCAGSQLPPGPVFLLVLVGLMLAAQRTGQHAVSESAVGGAEPDAQEERVLHGARNAAALAMVPIALVTLLTASHLLPEEDYVRPAYAEKLRNAILELDLSQLLDGANDGLSHGDLTALSDIRFMGDAALSVRVSEPRQLYLAGYTAAIFTGTNWENPPQPEYRRAADAFSDPLPQNLHAAVSNTAAYEISVRHADAPTEAAFLPNGLKTPADAIAGIMPLQDGALLASAPVYTVSALPFLAVPQPIPDAGSLAASYLAAAEHAAAGAGSAVGQSAAAYASYVTETYTQLPDSVRAAAERLTAQYGLSAAAENGSYDIAALCRSLREVLRSECSYVYDPAPLPAGADFAAWFLQQAREGYCVHFATTAAVLLRSLGIPTRYAEGYIVIRSDYEKPADSDGYVPIEDTHAHAWAEVFDPVQLVWIPVEMTPSASDAAPGASPAPSPSGASESGQQTAEPTATPVPTGETPQPAPSADATTAEPTPILPPEAPLPPDTAAEPPMEQSGAQPPSVTGTQEETETETEPQAQRRSPRLLLLLLLLPCAAGLWLLMRSRRLRRLADPDVGKAVLAAWSETQRLLRFADCPCRAVGQSAETYAAMLSETAVWIDAAVLTRLIRLYEQAAFSAHRCTAKESDEAVRLYAALRAALIGALPVWKRLLLWLCCP